jgi:hypothetical protein
VFSGLIVLFIVTNLFEIKEQGQYYLILSLVALQSFVDLGIIPVMSNVILRDWTEYKNTVSDHLQSNKISKIRGYFYFFLKWYSILSFILLFISVIFSLNFREDSQLFNLLISISFIVVLNFFLNLFWLFLEGIGDFYNLYLFRTIQLLFSTGCLFFFITCDFGIHSLLFFYSSLFFSSVIFIFFKWRTFKFLIFGERIIFQYFKEIFPFHFNVFIQSLFGYFTWQALIPLFYDKTGALFSGKLGVTLQIAALFLSFSTFLVYSKSPIYSKLLFSKSHHDVLNIWKKDLITSYLIFIFLILIYLFLFYMDVSLFRPFFNRSLNVTNSFLIFIIHFFYVFNHSISVLSRLNKKELLTVSGAFVPILSYAIVYFCIDLFSLDIIFVMLLLLNSLFFIYNYLKFKKFKSDFISI